MVQTEWTPWSRIFLEKLVVSLCPRFIALSTRARHRCLPRNTCIQSIPSHSFSLQSILMLSSHLLLGLPSSVFPSNVLLPIILMCSTCPVPHLPCFDQPNSLIFFEMQFMKLLIMRRRLLHGSVWAFTWGDWEKDEDSRCLARGSKLDLPDIMQ